MGRAVPARLGATWAKCARTPRALLVPPGGRQDRLRSETKPTMGGSPAFARFDQTGTRAAKTDFAMCWWPRGKFYCNARVEM